MKFLRDAYSLVYLTLLVGSVLITGCDDSQPPKPQPASLAPTVGSIHGGDSIAIVGQAFTEGCLVAHHHRDRPLTRTETAWRTAQSKTVGQ